jgi:hypothetical protein
MMSSFLGLASLKSTTTIIIWSLVLIAVIVGAFVAVMLVKKWVNQPVESGLGAQAGFTLSDLRRLHKSGEISNEEFEKARARILVAAGSGQSHKAQSPADGS